jgi:hypothetical protein
MKRSRQLVAALLATAASVGLINLVGCDSPHTAATHQSEASVSPTPALPDWIGGTPEPPPKQP